MISRQRIINLTECITSGLMNGKSEGGANEANKSLKFLLRNTVLQLAFIESSARVGEYEAFLKRLEKAHPGIKKEIDDRIFVIEEV